MPSALSRLSTYAVTSRFTTLETEISDDSNTEVISVHASDHVTAESGAVEDCSTTASDDEAFEDTFEKLDSTESAPSVSEEHQPQELQSTSDQDGDSDDDEPDQVFTKQGRPGQTVVVVIPPTSIPKIVIEVLQLSKKANLVDATSESSPVELYELDVLFKLTREWKDTRSDEEHDFIELRLSDFTISVPSSRAHRARKKANLEDLHNAYATLAFTGYASVNDKRYLLRDIEFDKLSVGYEPGTTTVRDAIWIQNEEASNLGIWYKLVDPAVGYLQYYKHFVWLATFRKHFVTYLEERKDVQLADFYQNFHDWLCSQYSEDADFKGWLLEFGRTDYRQIITTYDGFLWNDATNSEVDPAKVNRKHPVWKDVYTAGIGSIENHPYAKNAYTLVTPYVYSLFKKMYFSDRLKVQFVATPSVASQMAIHHEPALILNSKPVEIGDLIAVERDQQSQWKDSSAIWYAYVHSMDTDEKGRYFNVFWMYRPSDTICGRAFYPYANELFLSDHCSRCSEESKIYAADVRATVPLKVMEHPGKHPGSFVTRQMYQHCSDSFVTLEIHHFTCINCSTENRFPRHEEHQPGDTVLLDRPYIPLLQPVEILEAEDDHFVVRLLLRRKTFDASALLNELVYTDQKLRVHRDKISTRCHVRCERASDLANLAPPYSYSGVGNCWIITAYLPNGADSPVPIEHLHLGRLRQGFDPRVSMPSLATLDLFGGGGNLGRGFIDAVVPKIGWSVDIDAHAILTSKANAMNDDTAFFLGSAVDYFERAAKGLYSRLIARPGEVELILAGSPCPGFSTMQLDKLSIGSKTNASMVPLTISFIDLYRPKYAILENVFGMTRDIKDQNVLWQTVAALTSMEYQVNVFMMDAWSYGSFQNRCRIFVSAAAPGLTPITKPFETHSSLSTKFRSMGRTTNGLTFGDRRFGKSPFKFRTAAEASHNLPRIGRGFLRHVRHPDHRVVAVLTKYPQKILESVPCTPPGLGIQSALKERLLSPEMIKHLKDEHQWKLTKGKAFTRIRSDFLFPTILTTVDPRCNRAGNCVHWEENRAISLLEARRAQSIPDNEVLIGPTAKKYKLVGNGVDRFVAVSLGLAVRAAVETNVKLGLEPIWQPRPSEHRQLGTAEPLSRRELHHGYSDDELGNDLEVLDRPISSPPRCTVSVVIPPMPPSADESEDELTIRISPYKRGVKRKIVEFDDEE